MQGHPPQGDHLNDYRPFDIPKAYITLIPPNCARGEYGNLHTRASGARFNRLETGWAATGCLNGRAENIHLRRPRAIPEAIAEASPEAGSVLLASHGLNCQYRGSGSDWSVCRGCKLTAAIRLDLSPPAAEIVLNKPEKRNALSVDMWAAIPGLVETAVANPEVKVVLIHGGDAGAFAAGADISEFAQVYATKQSAQASGDAIAAALNALEHCPKPTLAAIDGACVGGGVSLAMACDLRVASARSRFGVTPGKLGLVYPAGDTRRLLQAVGPGATKDILFTGRIFAAEEAKDMHLIDRVCAAGKALETARALAADIAAVSQWSVRATKQMIRGLQGGWTDTESDATELFLAGFSNEDFQDGYKAFLEKRAPKFTFK